MRVPFKNLLVIASLIVVGFGLTACDPEMYEDGGYGTSYGGDDDGGGYNEDEGGNQGGGGWVDDGERPGDFD